MTMVRIDSGPLLLEDFGLFATLKLCNVLCENPRQWAHWRAFEGDHTVTGCRFGAGCRLDRLAQPADSELSYCVRVAGRGFGECGGWRMAWGEGCPAGGGAGVAGAFAVRFSAQP